MLKLFGREGPIGRKRADYERVSATFKVCWGYERQSNPSERLARSDAEKGHVVRSSPLENPHGIQWGRIRLRQPSGGSARLPVGDYATLPTEVTDGVRLITINRPNVRNAVNRQV